MIFRTMVGRHELTDCLDAAHVLRRSAQPHPALRAFPRESTPRDSAEGSPAKACDVEQRAAAAHRTCVVWAVAVNIALNTQKTAFCSTTAFRTRTRSGALSTSELFITEPHRGLSSILLLSILTLRANGLARHPGPCWRNRSRFLSARTVQLPGTARRPIVDGGLDAMIAR